MPNYLGTQTGLTGIPSLLLSSLSQVQDPATHTALYQIEKWANSVGAVVPTPGSGTPAFGAISNSPATTPGQVYTWVKVSIAGTPAYIPVWV